MGRIFVTKVTHARVNFSPLSSESMLNLARTGLKSVTDRWDSYTNVADNPAKPLNPKYAEKKRTGIIKGGVKYSGVPFRDWKLRGVVRNSLRVKSASENRAVMGFTTQQADSIVSGINKIQGGEMWPLSPKDQEAVKSKLREILLIEKPIRIVRGKLA